MEKTPAAPCVYELSFSEDRQRDLGVPLGPAHLVVRITDDTYGQLAIADLRPTIRPADRPTALRCDVARKLALQLFTGSTQS